MAESKQLIRKIGELAQQRAVLTAAVESAVREVNRLAGLWWDRRGALADISRTLNAALDRANVTAIRREPPQNLCDGAGVLWADKPEDDDIRF